MTFYIFKNARGQWRRPPKGIGEKHLVATYRHVRKIEQRGRHNGPVRIWKDGQVCYPLHPGEGDWR